MCASLCLQWHHLNQIYNNPLPNYLSPLSGSNPFGSDSEDEEGDGEMPARVSGYHVSPLQSHSYQPPSLREGMRPMERSLGGGWGKGKGNPHSGKGLRPVTGRVQDKLGGLEIPAIP